MAQVHSLCSGFLDLNLVLESRHAKVVLSNDDDDDDDHGDGDCDGDGDGDNDDHDDGDDAPDNVSQGWRFKPDGTFGALAFKLEFDTVENLLPVGAVVAKN